MAMTFRPPAALAERLRRQAHTEHLSMQKLLQKIAQEYLDRQKKKTQER